LIQKTGFTKYKEEEMEQYYMNIYTGSVGTYDEWWSFDKDGRTVNAVDAGEVVRVDWNAMKDCWEEAK